MRRALGLLAVAALATVAARATAAPAMAARSGASKAGAAKPAAGKPTALKPAAAKAAAKPSGPLDDIAREISAANIEATIRKLVSFGTRHSLSGLDGETRGLGAAARWVKSEFERYGREGDGRLRVEWLEYTAPVGKRVPKPTRMVNVAAILPGAEPLSASRLYVVSGHLDSRNSDEMDAAGDAPGANDDASGVAAVMEACRVLSKRRLDATVVFVAVSGEEQGLLGSTQLAADAAAKKIGIEGMITNDIVGSSHAEDGRIDRSQVRLFAEGIGDLKDLSADARMLLRTGGENDSPPRQFARAIKEAAEAHVPGMTVTLVWRRDRYLRGGDHAPFLDRGFTAVRMTEPAEDYRHQHQTVREESGVRYGDLPEFVDFEYVAQVARVDAVALGALASAPAPPRGVEMETAKLENDSTLRWQPNVEPDLARYEIVWRETTAPLWQHTIDAGTATRFTVKRISKDNVIFGVRAVDRDGNASMAVYPRPAK